MKRLGKSPFICLITEGKAHIDNYKSQRIEIARTIREAVSDGVNIVQIRESDQKRPALPRRGQFTTVDGSPDRLLAEPGPRRRLAGGDVRGHVKKAGRVRRKRAILERRTRCVAHRVISMGYALHFNEVARQQNASRLTSLRLTKRKRVHPLPAFAADVPHLATAAFPPWRSRHGSTAEMDA